MTEPKLTEVQVKHIRYALSKKMSLRKIAEIFHVHHKTISDIRDGVIYNPVRNLKASYSRSKNMTKLSAKLTVIQVKRIRKLLAKGHHTQADIASMFGVSSQTISLINTRKTWINI